MKNKSYIGISLVILVFGIIFIPNIVRRIKGDTVVTGDRLNQVEHESRTSDQLEVINKAPYFRFTNQDGKAIDSESFKGQVYVLEFFFSTCPTICPKMNENMKKVAAAFEGRKDFGIVSITINPEYDTPKVLREHREALGVTMANWHFLTGEKEAIFRLSNKGFNLFAEEGSNFNGGFEHSGLFALIDRKGNIRSRRDAHGNPIVYYDGLSPEGINALKHDIKILLNE